MFSRSSFRPNKPGQLHLKAFALAVPLVKHCPLPPQVWLSKSLTSFKLWLQVPLQRSHTPTTLFKIVTHSLPPTLPPALLYFYSQHLSPSNTHVCSSLSAPLLEGKFSQDRICALSSPILRKCRWTWHKVEAHQVFVRWLNDAHRRLPTWPGA